MKVWTAVVAALLVAGIRLGFALVGSRPASYLPFLETAVFVVSLFAFIKMAPVSTKKARYAAWAITFLVHTLAFVAIINFAYTGNAASPNEWLPDYAVLIIDFAAGLMFGLTFRIVSNLFRRNASR